MVTQESKGRSHGSRAWEQERPGKGWGPGRRDGQRGVPEMRGLTVVGQTPYAEA